MDRKPAGQTPTFSTQQINELLKRKSRAFADVLTGDPTRAKQKLQKHITKLVLTRTETPDGNVFEVSGDVALFVGCLLYTSGLVLNDGLRWGRRISVRQVWGSHCSCARKTRERRRGWNAHRKSALGGDLNHRVPIIGRVVLRSRALVWSDDCRQR